MEAAMLSAAYSRNNWCTRALTKFLRRIKSVWRWLPVKHMDEFMNEVKK